MVKSKSFLIFTTSVLSGIAVVLSLVSLGTEQWVEAKGEFTFDGSNEQPSTIKYGLFSGTLTQIYGGITIYKIEITCLLGKNVCAYLCDLTSELRSEQLQGLYRGENVMFKTNCTRVPRMYYIPHEVKFGRDTAYAKENREFLNAGLYVSTALFLCISVTFGVFSMVLSMWNINHNPIEVWLSIYGLYIHNTVALIASTFALILWGALFGSTIINNVGILYTIKGQMNTRGLAELGFSYWLLLPTCLLYATSIVILYVRDYLISQEPQIKIHTTTGNTDVGEIMIY